MITTSNFKRTIRAYYRDHGRVGLPWRHTKDPYAIIVSEVMLQQTQVARAEGYYRRFLQQFPSFQALAQASTADVLRAWQGLGYNRRALFLKKTAVIVVTAYDGTLPADRTLLETLPGIGKATSGALMAFAFNKPEIFVETNIRRVFIHFFFRNKEKVTDEEVERYIESTVDRKHPREWYWALMDYGSALGEMGGIIKAQNPNRRSAHYKKQPVFAGSDRELRGRIVRMVLAKKKIEASLLLKALTVPHARAKQVIARLDKEGFLVRRGRYICITT